MAYIISDSELERICERSEQTCNCDCYHCEAYWANYKYHND